MESNWLKKQVSIYSTHSDNIGRSASYRDILMSDFARDLPLIVGLRKLDRTATDYKIQAKPLKEGLQCFTPAALFGCKAAGKVVEIERTGLMQLDFDYGDINQYNLEELKRAVFSLPFIAFCGLSCSGHGFYALAAIAEPHRLADYAEHCFEILKAYDIKPDESKGKKPENLRYISYDANMLIRENPEPLAVTHFKKKQAIKKASPSNGKPVPNNGSNDLLNAGLRNIMNVRSGERFKTVQKESFTIGGLNNNAYLKEIKKAIDTNNAFAGEEEKYKKCAEVCFNAGLKKPLHRQD